MEIHAGKYTRGISLKKNLRPFFRRSPELHVLDKITNYYSTAPPLRWCSHTNHNPVLGHDPTIPNSPDYLPPKMNTATIDTPNYKVHMISESESKFSFKERRACNADEDSRRLLIASEKYSSTSTFKSS